MSVSLCMLLGSRVKRGVVRLRPDGFGCIHGVANGGLPGMGRTGVGPWLGR
jgi:hypothetical protein